LVLRRPPPSPRCPYPPLFRSRRALLVVGVLGVAIAIVGVVMWSLQRSMVYFPDTSAVPNAADVLDGGQDLTLHTSDGLELDAWLDRKSTRLNCSHVSSSYAVF